MPNFRNSSQDTIDANGETVTLAYRQFYNGGVGVQVTGTRDLFRHALVRDVD